MVARISVIEITKNGVHMRGEEVEVLKLADGTTKEFRKRGYAKALGINDFGGDRAAMLAEAERIAGRKIAELATENSMLNGSLEEERKARKQRESDLEKEKRHSADLANLLSAERAKRVESARQAKEAAQKAILAERADKAKLAEKLEKANAEKDQLLLAAQSKNDTGNAGRG